MTDTESQGMVLDVVINLLAGLAATQSIRGVYLFMDNYYTSPLLVFKLAVMGVLVSGTMRANRKGWPKQCCVDDRTDEKGIWRWMMSWRWPYMLASAWYDNKVVAHLSTIVGPKVKEITRAGGDRVVKPLVVAGYTWWMGGVDVADQKRSYYECKIGTAKWPTHLFLWLIDAAMVNSHIWYAEAHPRASKMSGREWRRRVFFGLMRLESGRKNSTTKVLLVPREPPPPTPPEFDVGATARQIRPTLKNRWGDHVPVRRIGPRAIACEWCKLKSKAAVASGRPAFRARESILVCSVCRRDDDIQRASHGCADMALCTVLCRSSTEVGATCFFLYHQHRFGATPTSAAGAPAAAGPQATPGRLDDAMGDA